MSRRRGSIQMSKIGFSMHMLYLFMHSFFLYTIAASFVKTILEKKLHSLAEMASANSNHRKAIRARKTHRTNTSLLICQLARRYGWGNLVGGKFFLMPVKGKGEKNSQKRREYTSVFPPFWDFVCGSETKAFVCTSWAGSVHHMSRCHSKSQLPKKLAVVSLYEHF